MSDELVKRLRDWEHVWPQDLDEPEGGLYLKAADRIEELEARLNFLIQPEMIAPSLSYRGWLIIDESDGNGNFWYAYDYDWKSGGFDDDKNFAMVSGDLDDVIEAIDRRIAELTGDNDE